jgi:hypothetical protein
VQIRGQLVADLQTFTIQDENSRKKEDRFYEVSSIYLDNYQLNSYREKLTGDNIKHKVRFRSYPPLNLNKDSLFYIELKNRAANKTSKVKSEISFSMFMDMVQGNPKALQINDPDPIISHVAQLIRVGCFHFHVIINYRRMALFSKTDKSVRITIDSDVCCERFQGRINITPSIPVIPKYLNILEVKTPGYFPDWMRFLVKKYGLQRESVSKYALSIQSIAVNSSMAIK